MTSISSNIAIELLDFVIDHDEIENSLHNINPIILSTFKEVYKDCCKSITSNAHLLKINFIVDYISEELHIGHWSLVTRAIKKAFYTGSFVKAVILLQNIPTQTLQDALKCIDRGILSGSPLDKNSELLTNSASYINNKIVQTHSFPTFGTDHNNKRKHEHMSEFENIKAIQVACKVLPSLECFLNEFYNVQIPVKIQESISHWPALHKWVDVSYLLRLGGERTVPIEIGSQYADENWSQKLMTIKEFIEKYYMQECNTTGYLAQHNLLDQIPELKSDIYIPEYCYTNRYANDNDSAIEINAWFGPKGTISSLHFDPKDNLLAQVYGIKLIIMFSPNDSPHLYPHQNQILMNTSKVNPLNPNLEMFPKFLNARMFKCILEPGDMLYIPPTWWHYVVALEKSFSVNFWWS